MDAEVRFGWTERQREATDAADRHGFVLFGGTRGPGKSYWLRWWLLRFCLLCDQAGVGPVRVGLFCGNYPELQDRQIAKMEMEFPRTVGSVRASQTHGLGFHLASGSVIALRNLDDPSKYQGAEFAAIGVDQLEQIDAEVFDWLRGSLRWPGITHTRFVATANPGGRGHQWVKAYWIDREYPPEFHAPYDITPQFRYVRGTPHDNPHLDESYWHMLNTLAPDLRRAWLDGDWDVFAGQAFPAWRRDRHVVEPFELPVHWTKWRAVDWGYASPFCCLWLAQDPDIGRAVVYRELYEVGLTDRQQAEAIRLNTPPAEKIHLTHADPSMWSSKSYDGLTFSTADEYRKVGVVVTPADNDRIGGWRKLRNLLENLPDGKPGLQVFSTCTNLIRTLPALPYSPTRAEDVDTDAEDHAADCLRYGLARVNPRPRPPIAGPVPAGLADPLLRRARVATAGLGSRDL